MQISRGQAAIRFKELA